MSLTITNRGALGRDYSEMRVRNCGRILEFKINSYECGSGTVAPTCEINALQAAKLAQALRRWSEEAPEPTPEPDFRGGVVKFLGWLELAATVILGCVCVYYANERAGWVFAMCVAWIAGAVVYWRLHR